MSAIARKTAVIFGSSAGLDQIAEFGSLAAGTPAFTTDPAVIQSLSNYTEGWFGAVIGGNSPAIEDMNALCYLFSYQIAYLLQAGIPVWDSGTTYFTGNFVSDGSGSLYYSLINNNLNNTPASSPSDWQSFPQSVSSSNELINLGLNVSVSSNAMTIALKQENGSTNPSTGTAAVSIGFRSATGSSGAYTVAQVTSALSIVIPSGASLGQTNAVNQYVWVYAINNGGTVDLCVSGVNLFQDNSIQSTTAITSGATSGSVLYSNSSYSNLPIRLIARLLVNETVAGTWASNTTDVVLAPKPYPTMTDWVSYTITVTGSSSNPTQGTGVTKTSFWRRNGDSVEIMHNYVQTGAGSAGSGTYLFNLPSGQTANTTLVNTTNNGNLAGGTCVGTGFFSTTSAATTNAAVPGFVTLWDSTHMAVTDISGAFNQRSVVGSSEYSYANTAVWHTFNAKIPILGWSTFGP